MSFRWPSKSPDEVQDYSLDWSRLLHDANSITGVSYFIEYDRGVKVPFPPTESVYGLTHNANSITGKVTTIFLSSGVLNRIYKIYCQITDNLGRVSERSVIIPIRTR